MSSVYKYHNVPDPTDTPDVPRDFKRLVDSTWNRTSYTYAQELSQTTLVGGGGNQEVVGVNHTFPAGSLLLVRASTWIGAVTDVTVNYALGQNGVAFGPVFTVNYQPADVYSVESFVISTGNSRLQLYVSANVGNVQVMRRQINVQALLRN